MTNIDFNQIEVTVLMSVYNGEKFLTEAIQSILKQTYKNFEFLIINDGSTDKTLEILKSFKDNRIIILNNESKIGLTASLNRGLKIAKGKYIARMDADDLSFPYRLEYQINYLKKNPEIGVIGSDVIIINDKFNFNKNKKKYYNKKKSLINLFLQNPETHNCSLWYLLFDNCFYHPTIMYKRSIINSVNGYQTKRSEDLDLWTRLFNQTKFYNIKIPLLFYRKHSNQSSVDRRINEYDNRIIARLRVFENLFDQKFSFTQISNLSLRSSFNDFEFKNFIKNYNDFYFKFIKKYSLSFNENLRVFADYLRFLLVIKKKINFLNKLILYFNFLIVNLKFFLILIKSIFKLI